MQLRKTKSSSALHFPITSIGHSLKKSINLDIRKQSLKKYQADKFGIDMRKSSKTILLLRQWNDGAERRSDKIRNSEGI